MKQQIQTLLDVVRGHKLYIQTHNFPDPDAIASAFGLQYFFRHFGIESSLIYDGSIARSALFKMIELMGIEFTAAQQVSDMLENDYIVTVDGQKYNTNFTDLPGDEVACIDHHPTVIPCEYRYKDVRIAGSCSTLITQYYMEMDVPMTTNVATALLYGLQVDTDNLTRGVTELDIDVFSYLYKKANQSIITLISTGTMELTDLKAYGAAIENIHIYKNTGYACIPFDCPDALIAMVSDFILSLSEVTFCVTYSLRENGLKFSIRSSIPNLMNAGVITTNALKSIGGGGGGHATMAGGFLPIAALEKDGIDRDHWDGIIEDAFQSHMTQTN